MRKKTMLILIACLLYTIADAQNRAWTFQQCLDTAIRRNISLNQSRLNDNLNQIALAQSKASIFPYVSASARDGVGFGNSLSPATNQYVEKTTNSSTFGLSTGVTLFNGLQITRTIMQNKMILDAL